VSEKTGKARPPGVRGGRGIAFRFSGQRRRPEASIFRGSIARPTHSPVNASPMTLPPSTGHRFSARDWALSHSSLIIVL
jgi:hypothetical protein